MLEAVNGNLTRFKELRAIQIPNDVSPPFHFSALVPGMTVNRTKQPFRMSTPAVKRPANLEDVAFWPVVQLAQFDQDEAGHLHRAHEALSRAPA
jgi:hypothetical protein